MSRDERTKILEDLGVKPVINACGTLTALGGSVIHEDIVQAWREASKIHVDMTELHTKAGNLIANLVGAEAAYITNGTAASLVISVAACMTEGDTEKMLRLPKTEGMRNEIIVQRLHRNTFDHCIELSGAKIVEIGDEKRTTAQELEEAINESTAAVVYFVFDPQEGVLPLDRVLEVSHERRIPVIVDAAAEIPPTENLGRYLQMGADLVLFSGGKDIGAPNDTGIILGRRELVRVCARLGPHSSEVVDSKPRGYIGRPMKTSKEDIFAVVAAIKRYVRTDHDQRFREWERKIEYMVSELSKCSRIGARRASPSKFDHPRPVSIPRAEIELREGRTTADDLVRELQRSDPPIYAYAKDGRLYLNPQCLRDGEEQVIVSRLRSILAEIP